MSTKHAPVTERVLELFRGPLKSVRFPDLDASTLDVVVSAVDDARIAVASAEASLEAARRALEEKEDALVRESERALAYAKIYAAERPELRDAIDAAAEPVRRGPGRPRKQRATEATAIASEAAAE